MTEPFLGSMTVSTYDDRDFIGGTLSSTGLLLDDVQKEGDWYYGSNKLARCGLPEATRDPHD
jgi:hypothetical protein